MILDIQQHLSSHDSFLYLQMYLFFLFHFCMCMVEGIRVLCAWERGRVYSLGMGKKSTFYVQIIWDSDESMTVNERGKEGRDQMGQIT